MLSVNRVYVSARVEIDESLDVPHGQSTVSLLASLNYDQGSM